MTDYITLSQGNGGRHTQTLIKELIAASLNYPPDTLLDAAPLHSLRQPLLMTTDSFTVQPLEFPGGSIGSLAIHGTVNDLAVAGAKARYLSLAMIIEEGLPVAQLQRIMADLAKAVSEADVKIVCGDTKVVPSGQASGLYLNTTGIGEKYVQATLGMEQIQPGDKIICSGTLGDHGAAVLMAREAFGLSSQLPSDSANVFPLVEVIAALDGLRFMRDPTRGGLSCVIHEIHQATALGLQIEQEKLPLRPEVGSFCQILGLEPWYLASEGRIIAIVAADQADELLRRWQHLPQGQQASIIGSVSDTSHLPVLCTPLGGKRLLPPLEDDPLPRIC